MIGFSVMRTKSLTVMIFQLNEYSFSELVNLTSID
jgi:hypothetical protein